MQQNDILADDASFAHLGLSFVLPPAKARGRFSLQSLARLETTRQRSPNAGAVVLLHPPLSFSRRFNRDGERLSAC